MAKDFYSSSMGDNRRIASYAMAITIQKRDKKIRQIGSLLNAKSLIGIKKAIQLAVSLLGIN